MLNIRLISLSLATLAMTTFISIPTSQAAQTNPKYYFRVSNIICKDEKIIPMAKELLIKEVESRPEFTMDLGADSEAAEITELQKQGLKGFQVTLRITSLKKEVKPPAPGQRDQQMAIEVKLGIFGHTIPGNKVMFTGEGEASLTGEFSERLKEKEEVRFMKTALESAIKQAVTTAAMKLTNAKLEDRGPSKGKRGKKGKP
jgi:hypothetical protein